MVEGTVVVVGTVAGVVAGTVAGVAGTDAGNSRAVPVEVVVWDNIAVVVLVLVDRRSPIRVWREGGREEEEAKQ